jgi:energy-coupling factor transport system permease protein
MSEFDFLSRMPMGQYISTGSLLHKIDPRVKIVFFLMLLMVITLSTSLVGLGISLVVLVVYVFISRIKPGFALRSLLPPLPFLLIIAVIQVLLYSTASDPVQLFSFGFIRVSMAGILAGSMLMVRFAALILCISLASFCISTSELIQGLQRLLSPLNKLKINTMDLVMVIQVMLKFLPFLAQTAERIAKAQASRGAEWGGKSPGLIKRVKQIIPLIIPLFLISLRRSENLALAMDARAYGFMDHRSSMLEMKFNWFDASALLLNTLVSLVILYV